MSAPEHALLSPLLDRQRTLWITAFLLYGVGDTVTTMTGLRADGVAEAGPIAAHTIGSIGPTGFLLQKVVFCVCAVVVWEFLRSPGRVAIPLALSVAGALVTGWNLVVLFG